VVLNEDWAARFNDTFAAPASAVQAAVWQEVLGDEYLPSLDTYSYVSVTELRRFADELRGRAVVADIGCGRGGPSLWVAGETGARLVGVDIAEEAVRAARERAERLGLAAEFTVGTFEALPLDTGGVDAVMSIDALIFTPDKAAAARELARVLRPGGRLVMTTWDFERQPQNRPPQVEDHRPLLRAAGFTVHAYDETEDWRRRQYETTDGMLARLDELAAEDGDDPDELRSGLDEMRASMDCMRRRVLVVADRVAS
jgi:ubiquinone/menaquinone biosynthesis C-methylase UbiE